VNDTNGHGQHIWVVDKDEHGKVRQEKIVRCIRRRKERTIVCGWRRDCGLWWAAGWQKSSLPMDVARGV